MTVERQEDATLAELQRRLRQGQYHIFHFVGHGGFDKQAEDGILILEDQEERGRRVSAQFLGTLLHDHRPLRLAILNACEGGRASRVDPFAGTAQSLVQQGIPAVIAMQFEVTDDAAICFTREFYAAIAVGYPGRRRAGRSAQSDFRRSQRDRVGNARLVHALARRPDFRGRAAQRADREQLQISSLLPAPANGHGVRRRRTAIDKLKQSWRSIPSTRTRDALRRDRSGARARDSNRGRAPPFDAGRWREALDGLRRVQAIDPAYRDTATLIDLAEKELDGPPVKRSGRPRRARQRSRSS